MRERNMKNHLGVNVGGMECALIGGVVQPAQASTEECQRRHAQPVWMVLRMPREHLHNAPAAHEHATGTMVVKEGKRSKGRRSTSNGMVCCSTSRASSSDCTSAAPTIVMICSWPIDFAFVSFLRFLSSAVHSSPERKHMRSTTSAAATFVQVPALRVLSARFVAYAASVTHPA